MLALGASALAGMLAADRGYRGPRIECGAGHEARFVSYRPREIDTVLGPVGLSRAYYHCPDCKNGHAPRDRELGLGTGSLSAGLAAMSARAGAGAAIRRRRAASRLRTMLTVTRWSRMQGAPLMRCGSATRPCWCGRRIVAARR